MRISVLMAVYNNEKWLPQALQSILVDQTHRDVELIAIDDCSTDSSPEILRQWASRDTRIKLLRTPVNSGQAVARNLGISSITGQAVCMVDSDDWLERNALERISKELEENPGADCAMFHLIRTYEDGRHEVYPCPYRTGEVISGKEAFVQSLTWKIHGFYVTRTELQRRYPFDDSCRLYSDDNTSRIHYLHSRRVIISEGIYYYRQHAESMTARISLDRFLYMEANLSLKRQMLQEQISDDIINMYEEHRWLNYIGQCYLYHQHRESFSPEERQDIQKRLRRCYDTFCGQPYRLKFGYTRLWPYALFVLQEWLYFSLRSVKDRYSRSY
jgi:glycosyltransferase involved in cell wall biosynthesis